MNFLKKLTKTKRSNITTELIRIMEKFLPESYHGSKWKIMKIDSFMEVIPGHHYHYIPILRIEARRILDCNEKDVLEHYEDIVIKMGNPYISDVHVSELHMHDRCQFEIDEDNGNVFLTKQCGDITWRRGNNE